MKQGTYKNIALEAIIPYKQNARTHSDEQIEQLVTSYNQFGFTNPLLVDEKNNLIAGHGRLMMAEKLKLDTVPCIVISDLDETKRRALILADNKIAMNAGWDDELLKSELQALKDMDLDLGLIGFSTKELEDLFKIPKVFTGDADAVPPVPKKPKSKLGQVYQLGQHRLMCGDSTDAKAVSTLLDGKTPHLMVTDPPYGVEYDADWRNRVVRADGSKVAARAVGKVMNDERADWSEAWALFPGDVVYVWHAGKFGGIVQESLEKTGFVIRNQIIWSKNVFAIGRGDYHWKHEPCWYAVRKGGKSHWNGSRKETTVWDINKPQKSETGHSTQKPIECMQRPMLNNSVEGDIVYDPFLGSGTTLIAAENQGRICYGMELNPAYIDVIIQRWEDYTGEKAVLEITG